MAAENTRKYFEIVFGWRPVQKYIATLNYAYTVSFNSLGSRTYDKFC